VFGRQWFPPQCQIGLTESALALEELLRKRKFANAIQLSTKCLSYADESSNLHHRSFWKRQLKRSLRLSSRDPYKESVLIRYIGFWPGFDEENNEIHNLLNKASSCLGLNLQVTKGKADIEVLSLFDSTQQTFDDCATKVLYLGENVRPCYMNVDYSLSFDIHSYSGKNLYVPLWILRSTDFGVENGYKPYDPRDLSDLRPLSTGKGICYIGNNETPLRKTLIQFLLAHGLTVDCYGSHTNQVADKIAKLSQYQYSICLENSYTPGYVTEKLIDGYIAGTIPIYNGGVDTTIFNILSFVNLDPYRDLDSDLIRQIECNQEAYRSHSLMPYARYLGLRDSLIASVAKTIFPFFTGF